MNNWRDEMDRETIVPQSSGNPAQPAGPGNSESMHSFRNVMVRTALIVLGLTPILEAATNGPNTSAQFCPPLYSYLTPTLLDVLIYPGISFR